VFFSGDPKLRVFFDLLAETFTSTPKIVTRRFMDLHALYSADGLSRFQKQAFASDERDMLLDKINNLYRAFKEYQIPVQVVTDISIGDAASIFRTLNTTGVRLTKAELQKARRPTKKRKTSRGV
jgi:hypothetical protein